MKTQEKKEYKKIQEAEEEKKLPGKLKVQIKKVKDIDNLLKLSWDIKVQKDGILTFLFLRKILEIYKYSWDLDATMRDFNMFKFPEGDTKEVLEKEFEKSIVKRKEIEEKTQKPTTYDTMY